MAYIGDLFAARVLGSFFMVGQVVLVGFGTLFSLLQGIRTRRFCRKRLIAVLLRALVYNFAFDFLSKLKSIITWLATVMHSRFPWSPFQISWDDPSWQKIFWPENPLVPRLSKDSFLLLMLEPCSSFPGCRR